MLIQQRRRSLWHTGHFSGLRVQPAVADRMRASQAGRKHGCWGSGLLEHTIVSCCCCCCSCCCFMTDRNGIVVCWIVLIFLTIVFYWGNLKLQNYKPVYTYYFVPSPPSFTNTHSHSFPLSLPPCIIMQGHTHTYTKHTSDFATQQH